MFFSKAKLPLRVPAERHEAEHGKARPYERPGSRLRYHGRWPDQIGHREREVVDGDDPGILLPLDTAASGRRPKVQHETG